MTTPPILRVVSLEPSRRCSKACAFCYNGSGPDGDGLWTADDVVTFGRDLAKHGVEALSLGGGEPLEWPGVFEALEGLRGTLARSLTTNGLPLADSALFARLVAAQPDKVHLSIHEPSDRQEVERVMADVTRLAEHGVPSGVNLVVRRSELASSRHAAHAMRRAGIGGERIVYLPLRGGRTPTPEELALVAGGPFQSMTCLRRCAPSERFVSVGADRTVAWCSYTRTRSTLSELTHAALLAALGGLGLEHCGGGQLVRLGAAADGAGLRP